jgi:hypothetical protein
MTPAAKFNALISSVTVFLMFWLVVFVGPRLTTATSAVLVAVGALVGSAGAYRLLVLLVRWVMERVEVIRALVLGPYYMHGTWIGWFRGHSGELRFMVEHFIQDVDTLAIAGRSFDATGKEHGTWFSQLASVDVQVANSGPCSEALLGVACMEGCAATRHGRLQGCVTTGY